jgi:ubiquinone/menaquinone biosynthesis C-methylase UbiE
VTTNVDKTEHDAREPTYFLVRDDIETQRLIQQSRLLNSCFRWLLPEAGISEGMKVLDVGSGAGDIALMAREIVGPSGKVVGVDVNPDALAVARMRAREAGFINVEFVEGDCRTADLGDCFDAVVGRLVLKYVADPADTLRSLTERLGSGGIVAFQEYSFDSAECHPRLPLWEDFSRWVNEAALCAGLSLEFGYELYHHFTEAGLRAPQMKVDAVLGAGPDWDGYSYAATTARSLLPFIVRSGAATAAEVGVDTLEDRLRAETVAAGSVVKLPNLVSAWTRKP